MRLNLKSVEERVKPLANRTYYDREFIFELLAAYGRSAGNITRLRNGCSQLVPILGALVARE